MHVDNRTSVALRDGRVGSHQLGMAWSVGALLRGWALEEQELRTASALTAEVAEAAQRSGRLMSLALTPDGRSLHVATEDDERAGDDARVHVIETAASGTTFVVARQRGANARDETDPIVWFRLTVADGATGSAT